MEKYKIDKGTKIILWLFVIYFIVVVVLFVPGYLKKRGKLYIVSPNYKIQYINGKWSNITNVDDYNMQEFEVFNNKSHLGKYKIIAANKLLLYDENGKNVKYDGDIFAYYGSFDIEMLNSNIDDNTNETDKKIVSQAIAEADIKGVSDYSIRQKLVVDIDYDGINETIYNVSNNLIGDPNTLDGIRETTDDNIFSLVFMYKDNEINIIDKKEDTTISKAFELDSIVDIKTDGDIELIYLDKYVQTEDDMCVKIYNLSDDKEVHNFCE